MGREINEILTTTSATGDVLRNFAKFTGKHLCQSLFLIKEALAQVFSCEFCEISKSIFFHRTPLVAASGHIFTNQEWQDLYFNRWRAVIFYSKLLVNILHRGCWDLKLGFMEVKVTIFINCTFLALKHIMYVWFHLIS